jgi:hypothetical protein
LFFLGEDFVQPVTKLQLIADIQAYEGQVSANQIKNIPHHPITTPHGFAAL